MDKYIVGIELFSFIVVVMLAVIISEVIRKYLKRPQISIITLEGYSGFFVKVAKPFAKKYTIYSSRYTTTDGPIDTRTSVEAGRQTIKAAEKLKQTLEIQLGLKPTPYIKETKVDPNVVKTENLLDS